MSTARRAGAAGVSNGRGSGSHRIAPKGAAARLVASLLAASAIAVAVAVSVAVTIASGAATQTPAPGNAASITARELRGHLEFVASDLLEGRGTPSRGLDVAALYLAAQLREAGVAPGGHGGSYFQEFGLQRELVREEETRLTVGERAFVHGRDFLARPVGGARRGPAVYAGSGWVVSSKGIDAYEGLDVEGKFVVVGAGLPAGVTISDLRGGRLGVDWVPPERYAREHGALGVLFIADFDTLSRWEDRAERAAERGDLELVESGGADASPGDRDGADERDGQQGEAEEVPTATLSLSVVRELFAGAERRGEAVVGEVLSGEYGRGFELDREIVLEVAVEAERLTTQNVVGLVRGADDRLSGEYVAYGAHYDHVGVGTPVDGDAIYNGADDDGSGTTALLEIAEAFAQGPLPRRSVLFVWHAGEERGLWGARHFTGHPTVPLDAVVAQINIDMIGRSREPGDAEPANERLTGPREVYVIGPDIMSDELGVVVHRVNDAYLGLELDPYYDEVDHPERFFFRSDHFHYARRGIPSVFFFSGVHEDYHRPSDEVDKIDFDKMEAIARTLYALGLELGNRDDRPVVNEQLPPQLREGRR